MIGRKLLHYTITAELGAGAMGRVFLATDERTGRRVALKLLASGAAGAGEARERLIREARAAARLSHPGIVALFAIEESAGELFLVQELVEGETLAARLARGPLGTRETLRLARELTAALVHAHAQGVLHRDLKPENVLIAADGSFKIADFGIARIEGAPTITGTGDVMGTLPYMSPERMQGARGDRRSDLFALGAILYEATSGRRAFGRASEPEVMYAVMHEDPPPLAPLAPALAPLAALVTRLLAKEPAQRPASAEEAAGMLEGIAAATGGRRNPARAVPRWAWAAAALVVVLGGGALWWSRAREAAGPAPAVAVLYFENIADPSDRTRIGSITGNLLITSLAQANDLNVLSRQRILDAMRQMGAHEAAVDRALAIGVARRAHARRIVTGSILQTEPVIVMTAEVSDVATGKVLDAARVDGLAGQTVFQVVDALGARLLEKMVWARGGATLAPVARRTSADLGAQRRYSEGLESLAHGDLEGAIGALEDATRRDPAFAQAHFELAVARWWWAEPVAARASIAAAQRLADRLTPLEREELAGVALLVDSRWEPAREWFDRLAREHPGEKLVHYGQVEACFHGHDWAGAVAAARRTLDLDPDFTLAGGHLTAALFAMGRASEAESTAADLLKRNPQNSTLWSTLVAQRALRGDREGVVEATEGARVAGVGYPFQEGRALIAIAADSVEVARSWMVFDRGFATVRADLRRGVDYWVALRRGRFHEAERIAQVAWRELPPVSARGDVLIPEAYGIEAAAGAHDEPRAMAWADSVGARVLGRLGPNARLVRGFERAAALVQMGRIARAREELEALSAWREEITPWQRGALRFTEAVVLGGEGRPREGLAALSEAEWPGPPHLGPGARRLVRARLLLLSGDYAGALGQIDTLRRVPVISPDDAVRLHLYRGRALEKLGRGAEAAASYREFLRLWKDADPGTPEIPEARAALERLARAAPGPSRRER